MKIGSRHSNCWALVVLSAFLCGTIDAAFDSTYSVLSTTTDVSSPKGIFYNPSNDKLIMVEELTNRLRVVQGGVTTFIDGTSSVPFAWPYGLWVDTVGETFVTNHKKDNIVKVDVNGQLSIIAGTGTYATTGDGGPATSAALQAPTWAAADSSGNVYIVQQQNDRIRKINKDDGIISTVIGTGVTSSTGDGGSATSATMDGPTGLFIDSTGDIYITTVADNVEGRVRVVSASTGIIQSIAGTGQTIATTEGILAAQSKLNWPAGLWGDSKGYIYVGELLGDRLTVIAKENNYEKVYLIASMAFPFGVWGDEGTGRLFVTQYHSAQKYVILQASPSAVVTTPSALPSTAPSSAPSEVRVLVAPEYSLTVSAKSFKYFEVRVFTEANERVFPVSYNLVDCPENAGAVIWGHESTPITEDTNTCVYGLPRHYWCECPALVNGNKPKLTLNFGGTVFDRVELLILDWVDGELTVSDSANNIVLFTASRAGGPLVGEEFVGYNHLNLLQVAPSMVPTVTPSSVPTTKPSWIPTTKPTVPSIVPTQTPSMVPTTTKPSAEPSVTPSMVPSAAPSFTAQYTITLTAKTFKYFEVRVYTHDNLRIFPVSYELEHCPENAGVAVWNDQTTEDTNTCVYGYPRNFWCQCSAVADAKPKLVLHMGHTVFDRVELLLLNWEDGVVTVTDEANHETFLSATHDGVGNEFVTFGNLNLEHAAAPVRRLLRGA